MYTIMLLSSIFFAFGLYLLISEIVKVPTIQTSKGILSLGKGSAKAKNIDIYLDGVAERLSKYIKLNEYKRKKLQSQLKTAGINKTPEKHIASTIIKAGIPVLFGIPFLFVFPVMFPILLVVGLRIYFKEVRFPEEKIKIKREKIENELPKFTRDIEQNLKSTRDILFILENYKQNAGQMLKDELDITTADMKTGNYETALTRFETRIQSPMLSDVIKGLIAVIRGDNAVVYFQMLSHDFKQLELQKLKQEAAKRPGKIRKYSLLMLGCMILIYVVVFVVAISQGAKGLFS
ncbi:secretion protein F [Sporanaerobacter acetigenes]|uniref:Tight adherence protein C n=1 Tax=Sporanaerobacter acetigenes DSM 13106 TaxID=1123281 RepID=A0A1M5U8H9_9FIRM|nr:secretion protein F [Sporanaerobacter acetigenes]SHH58983.1 hypothetical protein SAMN02745180_00551 [Sporanaerobacter acetigenes DSM 13106]